MVRDETVLQRLIGNRQIALRYVRADGSAAHGSYPDNPNGSVVDIAGLCDRSGRVLGLMPHPERSVEGILGSTDGLGLFESLVAAKAPLVGLGAR